MDGTTRTVVTAFLSNLAIAVAKFVGAFLSGSTALLAEGVHSVVDTFNEVFLYLGLHLQRRPPSAAHPLGHGRERFFWSFVAAMFIFTGGALVSLYEGVEKVLHPHPVAHVPWALGVLAFAFLAEGWSFVVGLRESRARARLLDLDLMPYLRQTRDSTLLTVVLEDAGALVGILIAAAGIGASAWTGDGRYDGVASVLIGLMLAGMAFVLGGRSHALLIGLSAPAQIHDRLMAELKRAPFVRRVRDAYTVQIAPAELVLAAELELREDLVASDLVEELDALEAHLVEEVPYLKHVFLEVEPPGAQGRPSSPAAPPAGR